VGLGVGVIAPTPKAPIPNPQSPIPNLVYIIKKIFSKLKIENNFIITNIILL
jgi:hypothetical protein